MPKIILDISRHIWHIGSSIVHWQINVLRRHGEADARITYPAGAGEKTQRDKVEVNDEEVIDMKQITLGDVVREVGGWPIDVEAVAKVLVRADKILPRGRDDVARPLTPDELDQLYGDKVVRQ